MPSTFDNLFRDQATPQLAAMFGESVSIIVRSGESGTTTYTPTAQVGREEVKRVRTKDGYKVLRVREILVSLDATEGVTPLPQAALKTLQYATVNGVQYIIAAFDIAPGRQARLTLERSDASDVSRPNLKARR